jgi:hypothetical protein
MADGRYETVSTFVLPNEYQRQAAEARRRRRMAELMAQQAYQPGDIQNAPIPAAAPLVQGLQAFLAARGARKAEEAEESAQEAQTREARQFLKALTEEDTVTEAKQPDMPMGTPTVTAPQLEGGRITAPAQIDVGAPPPMEAPQVQLSRYGNLTQGQRRALALEGVLTSQNPLVQKIGQMQYAAMQPQRPEIGAVSPADFTPESLAEYQRTGNFGVLKLREQPVKAPTTEGGMMWDAAQGKFVDIPGYEAQQGRIAAAKRPDVVVRDAASKGPSESAMWRAEDKLRGDFEEITAPFRAQLAETQKITDIFKNYGNDAKAIAAIPQQSLVILLNKFLDPTSVVREGEFNRVVEAQGLEARARNYIARIMEGKPLDVSAINQIADLAKLYERAADAKIRQYAGEYSTIAETRGLDVGTVITNPNYRPRKKIADEDVEVQ